MADKFRFELVSPERLLMSAEVDRVMVPGADGDFGVLAGHAPVMSTVRPGVIDVLAEGDQSRIFVRGGFAEVTPAGLTVLAEEAIDLASVERETIEQKLKDAEEDLEDADTDEKRTNAAAAVEHLRQIRDAL